MRANELNFMSVEQITEPVRIFAKIRYNHKGCLLYTSGPCLVLAGPGSGKTLTIVNRVKYLIEGYKVRPEEILVVTFTRFAAAEMRSRLCSLM